MTSIQWGTIVAMAFMASSAAATTLDTPLSDGDESIQRQYVAISSTPAAGGVVVWESFDQDGDGRGIFGRRLGPEGTLVGTEFMVNSWTTGDQYAPSVAVAKGGSFIVVWASYGQDGDRSGIFGQRFGADGYRIGSEFQLNRWAGNYQGRPDVTFLQDPNTGFVAVWEGYEPIVATGFHIYVRRFGSSGQPIADEFEVDGADQVTDQKLSAVAALPDGGFVVAWTDQDFLDAVMIQSFDADGKKRGAPRQVNDTSHGAVSLDLSVQPSGDFVVAWTGYHSDLETYEGIHATWARTLAADGTPLRSEFRTDESNDWQGSTSVACQDNGQFLITWSGRPSWATSMQVMARDYDATGNPMTAPFLVNLNHSPVGSQIDPQATALKDGAFFVAWTDRTRPETNVFGRYVPGISEACSGDCDRDNAVSVAELITGIRIALDFAPLDMCAAFDHVGDGEVTIEDLVTAVKNAILGCQQ